MKIDSTRIYHFDINNFLWNSIYFPMSSAELRCVEDDGIYVSMTCIEKNPLCRHFIADSPVYLDSAMEFFMYINSEDTPYSEIRYLNLEANSSGSLLSQFGVKSCARLFLSELTSIHCTCCSWVSPHTWGLHFYVPLSLLHFLYGIQHLSDIDHLACNFYKISETPGIRHFASAFIVTSDHPDFHRPDCFGFIE